MASMGPIDQRRRRHLAWSLILVPSFLVFAFWGLTNSTSRHNLNSSYLDDVEKQGFLLGQSLLQTSPEALKVGIASRAFSIHPGEVLGGYLQLKTRRSKTAGVVQVGALALVNDQHKIVVTSLDAVTVSAGLRQDLLHDLPSATQLITTASHVHSGPGGFADNFVQRQFLGADDPVLRARLLKGLTQVCLQALKNARPAQLFVGHTEAPELIKPRGIKTTTLDATIDLLQFQDTQKKPIGSWVFFAAHPTLIGNRLQASADYPGFLREALGDAPEPPVLFAASATGSASAALPDAHAQGLALAKRVRSFSPVSLGADLALSVKRVQVSMPPPALRLFAGRALNPSLSSLFLAKTLPVDVIRLGSLVWVILPGELSAELSGALRRQFADDNMHLLIAAHNGAYGGYFMPSKRYGNGSVEAPLEFYGPGAGQVFVRLLAGLRWGLKTAKPAP